MGLHKNIQRQKKSFDNNILAFCFFCLPHISEGYYAPALSPEVIFCGSRIFSHPHFGQRNLCPLVRRPGLFCFRCLRMFIFSREDVMELDIKKDVKILSLLRKSVFRNTFEHIFIITTSLFFVYLLFLYLCTLHTKIANPLFLFKFRAETFFGRTFRLKQYCGYLLRYLYTSFFFNYLLFCTLCRCLA